jgi:hypothetical protein
MTTPRVTALVSTYASERYLAGCLDDLLGQTLGERLEIVVVDANSPEREGELVRAYQGRHGNIRYLRTETRECTSAAFNRATALARAPFLTTANTDDRHHPEFAARLAAVLEQRDAGIVYADAAIGTVDNEPWATTTATRAFAWPHYSPGAALSCGLFGPQPMWRRELHDRVGAWDTDLKIANDQDMFLRLARAGGAMHVAEVLGLFLQRPDSNSGVQRRQAALAELLAVFRRHRRAWALDEIVPGATANGPFAEAAAWFELGNLCALGPYTDAESALDCYRAAMALPLRGDEARRVQQAFANNSACILAAAGARAAAARAFALTAPSPRRDHNLGLAQRASPPTLRVLQFVELEHAIVQRSRTAPGVTVDACGGVHDTAAEERRPWDVFTGMDGVPWRRTPAPVTAGH